MCWTCGWSGKENDPAAEKSSWCVMPMILSSAFSTRRDAERFLTHLRQRLEQFKLQLHPRLIRFGRFAAEKRKRHRQGKPQTFGFLGFTHICGLSQKGGFVLMRHTIAKRQRAKLQAVKDETRVRQHLPIPVQGAWLADVLRGYFAYHAVPTNIRSLDAFRTPDGPSLVPRPAADGARNDGSTGRKWIGISGAGCHQPKSCILGRRRASNLGLKARAECGNPARSDLCGGPEATPVPTATLSLDRIRRSWRSTGSVYRFLKAS